MLIGFSLGVVVMTRVLIPHLKPDVTISTIYKRRVKVSDEGKVESTINVEDLDASETTNKKNRVRRRDR